MNGKWFQVPGQNCPVALGNTPCETSLDSTKSLSTNPNCGDLEIQSSGLGWTSSGAVRNSSAGKMMCHPFRKVCVMENYEDRGGRNNSNHIALYILLILITLTLFVLILNQCIR